MKRSTVAIFGMFNVPFDSLVQGWVFGHFVSQMPGFVNAHYLILAKFVENVC